MNVAMAQSNPRTSIIAIDDFSRNRQLRLPASYISFLLSTNGGIPRDPAFPIEGMANNPLGVIQAFAGLGVQEPTEELAYAYDLYAGGIPQLILPIASNGGGDYLCLDLRNGRERVAFWDKRHYWGTGEWREGDFYHVANTFDEFLASLRPNPY